MGNRDFQFQRHYNFTGEDFNKDIMQMPVSHPLKFLYSVLNELISYIINIQHFILIDSPGAAF